MKKTKEKYSKIMIVEEGEESPIGLIKIGGIVYSILVSGNYNEKRLEDFKGRKVYGIVKEKLKI